MEKSFDMIVLMKISIFAKTEVFTKGLITKKKKKKKKSQFQKCVCVVPHYKLSFLKFS